MRANGTPRRPSLRCTVRGHSRLHPTVDSGRSRAHHKSLPGFSRGRRASGRQRRHSGVISAPPGREIFGLAWYPRLCRGPAADGHLGCVAEAGLAGIGPAGRGAPSLRGLPRVAAGAQGVLCTAGGRIHSALGACLEVQRHDGGLRLVAGDAAATAEDKNRLLGPISGASCLKTCEGHWEWQAHEPRSVARSQPDHQLRWRAGGLRLTAGACCGHRDCGVPCVRWEGALPLRLNRKDLYVKPADPSPEGAGAS
ncbi:hypothetical protein NDU88_006497 [Pleurodeles waltl]|uniref:Uncharacterized protein n=1 Tax=Pleurodeles waltl TaxID=8319 RepID=A0AAV7RRD5_PLEWA|nr:hypothetical protein NDU88_006497 [Pleurodeles waltl]